MRVPDICASAVPHPERNTLHVLFSMDCERIAAESPPGGPPSWGVSERSIRGYCQRLLAAGFPPTLFLMPECARQHRAMLLDLEGQGVELGLHVHPQSLADHRYTRYLGEYSASEQHKVLALAVRIWAEALGRTPRAFRGGNFSASGETYGVLVELGFAHGSVSDPGRHCPAYAAEWLGADPGVHWASASDPLIAGDLPFCEFPLTTDPDSTQPNGLCCELRIESGAFAQWHRPIIGDALARQAESPPAIAALSLFTHNYLPYDEAADPRTATLQALIEHLLTLRGQRPVLGCTLAEGRRRFASIVGEPAQPPHLHDVQRDRETSP